MIGCFEGPRNLCEGLRELKCLQMVGLNLSQNEFDDDGLSVLIDWVGDLKRLQELRLNLNGNSITGKGIKKFAMFLEKGKAYRDLSLDFSENKLDNGAAVILAHSLKNHYKFDLVLFGYS